MAFKRNSNEDQEDAKSTTGNVGALLKASRLRLGDDLRYVAETLHIRFIYLEAIEGGRYDELPGTAYAIGFIRSYADYLGLDSGEVVRRYKVESTGGPGDAELVFPVPIPETSIPGGAIVFVGFIIALLTYGVWYLSTVKDGFLSGLVTEIPERMNEQKEPEEREIRVEPVEATPEVAETEEDAETSEQPTEVSRKEVSESAEISSTPVTEAQPEAALVPEVTEKIARVVEKVEEVQQAAIVEVGVVVKKVEAAAESATSETVQAATEMIPEPNVELATKEPITETELASSSAVTETARISTPELVSPVSQTFGEENKNSRILVKADKNSWIQVRDNNKNRMLLTRFLRAGDSYRVPNQQGLVLLTGNAGALEIYVDGEKVPDLGVAGKIRRNVPLDPESLRQGSAAN